jgi:hypothetical protein
VERSYSESIGHITPVTTHFYEEYFVPQYELKLATDDPRRAMNYDGMLAIRKAVDLDGRDCL